MTSPSYYQARNDAGLLREYVAHRYGAALTFGGSLETMRLAELLVSRLATMTGQTKAAIRSDIRSDYEAAEQEGIR